jgi:hypothetical protein
MQTGKFALSKPKAYSTIVLALSILLGFSLLFNVIQATTPTGGPYYLSVPTSTWKFLIGQFSNGSYYMVNGDNWHVDYQSPSATLVINYAIGNLTSGRTWQEKVKLQAGNYTLTKYGSSSYCINVPSFTELDTTEAELYLADGQDCDMIVSLGTAPSTPVTDVVLRTGYINGNEMGQTANVSIVFWNATRRSLIEAQAQWVYPKFAGLRLDGWTGGLTYTVENTFMNLRIYYSENYGIYIDGAYDNRFIYPYIQECGNDGIFMMSGTNYYDHLHVYNCASTNGQANIRIESNGNYLLYPHADTPQKHGIYLNGENNTIENPFAFSASQLADNIYDEIRLIADYNTIIGGRTVGHIASATNSKYGLHILSGSDFNNIIGLQSVQSQTLQMYDANPVSTNHFANCWNGSSFITDVNENAGSEATCINGTAIAHGLSGTPTSLTLSLRGPTAFNATIILCAPTVLSLNATHFVVELTAWETVSWTLVPITASEAQTIYWIAVYKP